MKWNHTLMAAACLAFAIPMTSFAQPARWTAQEQANVDIAKGFWKDVLQAGHLELATKYQGEYIQHNPSIATGTDGFVKAFQPGVARRGGPSKELPAEMKPAPALIVAKGPYVMFVWEREAKDKDGATYKYNFFDLLRIEGGKVQEHWDSVFRVAGPNLGPLPVDRGIGPKPVAPPQNAQEKKAIKIANVEFKDVIGYGHLELADKVMAPGYIQHNPNVPTGRDGFKEFFGKFAKPEPIKPTFKDEPELEFASGDLVVYMMKRFSPDPLDPSKVYKWNWFDMVRVDGGMVQEHWDMAMKTQTPMNVPKPADFKEYR